ncbi:MULTISPECIES: peptidoglycan DD-metalloendopeptidase family protein [Oceanobacillus]|uniref:Peptidase M23 n=1 Tax=Oceanobacillus kimchii TaxID=746691 RepID=A0ABQ5TQ25_9BACI|nr:peptidoglycan DD-metalloendopeptidase family protein [Oceanobacillus kimchii]GLO68312.1 hypothetical protein MACH08_40960 [Oceanobacillus kimchii]
MAYHYDPFSQKEPEQKESNVKKVAKQVGNKAKNQALKKLGKTLGKLALKGVKAGAAVLGKALIALLGTVGLPAILVIVGIILLIIIITLVSSALFGGGIGLNDEQQDLHDHIVEESNNTVDMDNPEQSPYKVPVELLSSVVQLEAMQNDDHYEIVSDMADTLKPTFTYSDEFNEWKETQTQVCKEGEKCEPWSDIERVDNYVSKLTEIDYWQGNVRNEYTEVVTDWKTTVEVETITEMETQTRTHTYYEYQTVEETVTRMEPYETTEYRMIWDENGNPMVREVPVTKYREVKETIEKEVPVFVEEEVEVEVEVEKELRTYTKTREQYYEKNEIKTTDYTYLDTALNSLGFGLNDKRLLETNYKFQNLPMDYIAWLEGGSSGGDFGGAIPYPGNVIPGSDIPVAYMQYYLDAEAEYGVHWYVLASVHAQETQFSTHPTMISSAGAIGHMQFLPATWAGWKYSPGNTGLVPGNIDITSLSIIKSGGGYGVDANGDGKADPWDLADAIHSAANYLASSGYAKNPATALLAYNQSTQYGKEVLARADRYKTEAVYEPGDDLPVISDGTFTRPTAGVVTSRYGNRNGGFHYGIDLGGTEGVSPIVAAANGTVSRAYYSDSYGHVVFIKHNINGKAYETIYAHLYGYFVSEGQKVNKGEQIGLLGNTGRSTGPHLHFEIHSGSWTIGKENAINPERMISF